jgi:hypothetical protein
MCHPKPRGYLGRLGSFRQFLTPGIILNPHEDQYGTHRGRLRNQKWGLAHYVQLPADAEMTRQVHLCRRDGNYMAVSGTHSTDRGWPLVMGWLQFAFGGRV